MNTERAGRAAEIAPVGPERGCDELLFELIAGLFEGNALANELVDNEVQSIF